MKKMKFCLSLLLTLVLMAGMVSMRPVFATTGTMHVEVEEAENGVVVKLVADAEMDFGGIWFSVEWDDDVFTFAGLTSPIGTATEGADTYEINTGTKVSFAAGDAIVTITYSAGEIEVNKEYEFKVTILEAYDDDEEDHVAANTALSATYMKEEEPTEEPTEETTEAETTAAETTEAETTAAETTAPETTKAPTPATAPAETQGTTPPSGDDSNNILFIAMGCTAAVLLAVVLIVRRKDTKAE